MSQTGFLLHDAFDCAGAASVAYARPNAIAAQFEEETNAARAPYTSRTSRDIQAQLSAAQPHRA